MARLREELGGLTADEQRKARRVALKTTVLALATEPGMVCAVYDADMPAAPESSASRAGG
jgi:hypothetical protein